MATIPRDNIEYRTDTIDRVLDFLLTQPTLQQIIDFRATDEEQQRLHDLLDKNRDSHLTVQDDFELHEMRLANHVMGMLKARAMLKMRKIDETNR